MLCGLFELLTDMVETVTAYKQYIFRNYLFWKDLSFGWFLFLCLSELLEIPEDFVISWSLEKLFESDFKPCLLKETITNFPLISFFLIFAIFKIS